MHFILTMLKQAAQISTEITLEVCMALLLYALERVRLKTESVRF